VTLASMTAPDAVLAPAVVGATSWDGWVVAVDSDGAGSREGRAFDGTLPATTAVVLRRG
jgi:hypothetical protein